MSKTPPIVNLDEIELEGFGPDASNSEFGARLGAVGNALGSEKLGCRLVVLAPGKRAWPYHLHHANEEMFLILAGEGSLRYDDARYPIRTGDVISTGVGPGTAHQIINDSRSELRYLAFSTMAQPEVAEYPDSDKIGAIAGASRRPYPVFHFTRAADTKDYWDGEG